MWRLLLGRKEIVGWPYKWTEGFRLGILLETGFGRDPGLVFSTKDPRQFTAALSKRKLRISVVSEIQSITVTCSIGRNRIEILGTNGHYERYGIVDRWRTDEYRKVLRSLYPNRYRESGFPQTTWEKIAKF